jgi:hypothetical protein
MSRILLAVTVPALLLAACISVDPPAVVDEQAEARAAATAAAEDRLDHFYAADPATAAACAAADTLAFDLLASNMEDDAAVIASLHRIDGHAHESDDSQLRGLARFALAAGAQERGPAVAYHLGSVQIVCDHYRDDLS